MASKRMILVVEDNELNREILCAMLEDTYTLMEASDGMEGLEKLRAHYRELSLVLLDVHMPRMNGYEFLRAVHADGVLSEVPIIVTTGANTEEDEEACLALGAADFIKKPYNPNITLRRIQSVIRLKESSATLHEIEFDELTGLYTQKAFYHHAERMLREYPDERFDLMLTDIENFQRINERYGTATGDETLRLIGKILSSISSETIICGRYGADQFAILYRYRENISQKRIWELYGSLKEQSEVSDLTMKFSAYEDVEHDLPAAQLCDRAISAIRTIKHQYNTHYIKYDEELKQRFESEFQIESSMQRALEEHQFKIFYQPKHDLESDTTCGAEALVRWIHPEMGFMNPGVFIPLFERNGFIKSLDRYMLEEVCKTIARWKQENRRVVPISVNISRRDFEEQNLVDIILSCTEKYQVEHELLHLEITESSYTDNPEEVTRVVQTLHDAGFVIELDDFGTGYSSLTSLNSLALDVIKLDMSIIRKDVPGTERNVLEFAMMLAKVMKLKTVQEGVETEEQVERVKDLGCDYVQGYYFSKPLPVAEFEAYLEKK